MSRTSLCPHCNKLFFNEVDLTGDYGIQIDLDKHAVIEMADGREFSMVSSGIGAGIFGTIALCCGLAARQLMPIGLEVVVLSSCATSFIGALLPFAVTLQKPFTNLHQPDIVEIEDLVQVSPTQMRLRNREIELPVDTVGKPLFTAKQLSAFSAMATSEMATISEDSASGFGLSRKPYTAVREWAISNNYLRYKSPDNKRGGVFITGSGKRFFNKVADRPTEE